MHLVDFIIRIYHDARSHECKTNKQTNKQTNTSCVTQKDSASVTSNYEHSLNVYQTAREDLLITSTDNSETSDKCVSPESRTACLPFLRPIPFNIIFFHASISPLSLSPFPPAFNVLSLPFTLFLSVHTSLLHLRFFASIFFSRLTISFPIISSLFFSLV